MISLVRDGYHPFVLKNIGYQLPEDRFHFSLDLNQDVEVDKGLQGYDRNTWCMSPVMD